MELWKAIKGYEGLYEVSSYGRVRSIGTGNWRRKNGCLACSPDSMGYPHVILHKDGRGFTTTVHRLVAKTFIPNPENLPQVNHKDTVKSNNHVDNLEWCTCKQNQHHARESQLQEIPKGSECWNSKLTEDAVIEIRRRYAAGGTTYKELAPMYGVSPSVIGFAIVRKTWKHVP